MGIRTGLVVLCVCSLGCSESLGLVGEGEGMVPRRGEDGGGTAKRIAPLGWAVAPHFLGRMAGEAVGNRLADMQLRSGISKKPLLGYGLQSWGGMQTRLPVGICMSSSGEEDDIPGFLAGILPEADTPTRGSKGGNEGQRGEEEDAPKMPENEFPLRPPAKDARPAAAQESQPPSSLWGDWTEEQVINAIYDGASWILPTLVGSAACSPPRSPPSASNPTCEGRRKQPFSGEELLMHCTAPADPEVRVAVDQ